jgi:hypothetical protein
MSEEVGKIEKPSIEEFRAGRKLYFVPLIFTPKRSQADLLERVNGYWDQVETHVANLEAKLGNVSKLYHELVPVGGEDGAKAIKELNKGSYQIIKTRLKKGSEIQPMEDGEILAEFMDWGRCLAIGLQSQNVIVRAYEFYSEAQRRRNDYIAKKIDETLQDGEIGLVLMMEGHQVQFPSDVQVFYVSPPGLDEVKRWIRDREAENESGTIKRSKRKVK